MNQMEGKPPPQVDPDTKKWPLHLKRTTPVDLEKVVALPHRTANIRDLLLAAMEYLKPEKFQRMYTRRSLTCTQLTQQQIDQAIENGKFEKLPNNQTFQSLPEGYHGVNVFSVPELKQRRRIITEPHLNASVDQDDIPQLHYPSRLERRQSLKRCKYMLQIDFDAFYDAIGIPEDLRRCFVFRKGQTIYRLRTIPTGARWSVAVGQAITSTIVDVDRKGTVIHTMIDNILIGAEEGNEESFYQVAMEITRRIQAANLTTTPPLHELTQSGKTELLQRAAKPTVFLGEEYVWKDGERRMRNSIKTRAKIALARGKAEHSYRTLAGLLSLVMYAIHTVNLNPAKAFFLLKEYAQVGRAMQANPSWDTLAPPMTPEASLSLQELAAIVLADDLHQIPDKYTPTYEDDLYTHIVYTDASRGGWAAVAFNRHTGETTTYQQRWVHDTQVLYRGGAANFSFMARHSAHAEPRAAQRILNHLLPTFQDGDKIALVTDHFPIMYAQRKLNGYGGVGRGFALNALYRDVFDLQHSRNIHVTFFHIPGKGNPADAPSRNFGACRQGEVHMIKKSVSKAATFPPLRMTSSFLCDPKPYELQGSDLYYGARGNATKI